MVIAEAYSARAAVIFTLAGIVSCWNGHMYVSPCICIDTVRQRQNMYLAADVASPPEFGRRFLKAGVATIVPETETMQYLIGYIMES